MPAAVSVDVHAALNAAQREAVLHRGDAPLLIIAGAGTGKTTTLAHRLAQLVLDGADPRRILLLTFSRRAAHDMTRRALQVVARTVRGADLPWAGTFHAIGSRLLRLHAPALGLDPGFTVLDRGDAADLLDVVRADRGLGKGERRFPRKDTCLAIYSRTVNARVALEAVLDEAYPWCREHAAALRGLFGAYVEEKLRRRVLDYDDLLLWWWQAMAAPDVAAAVRARFDHVLVDEYQDTNALQAEIVVALAPDGRGVTAVGDDAQAIYSFRAATVRNILDFPRAFATPARLVALEDNYRSTAPIVAAANAVIERAAERHDKRLRTARTASERPTLALVEDEAGEVDYVVEQILAYREAGLALRDQAVLTRAAHHADLLELELGRRKIPYVKYGGLKFLEAAHVKDLLAILRWAENPVDLVAGFRVAQLLPGVGPAFARRAVDAIAAAPTPSVAALQGVTPPRAARDAWPALCELLVGLADPATPWPGQVGRVRRFYDPILAERYDGAPARAGDLEQLEAIAGTYAGRAAFLEELTLDPPGATGDQAAPPALDEDWLVLSTIHSAKGQEWKAVFVLDVVDGRIPSDLAAGSPAQLEEERRLLYVAMTRARDHLHLVQPLRFYVEQQHRHGDRHVYAPRSRFLPDDVLPLFERVVRGRSAAGLGAPAAAPVAVVDVAARLRAMW
ncbi:MAG TPA: ATP-dependent helicase [Kofleriaceae bacterium]|nr:ATP-dependent helicase [Kofleriaceae bacterium]